MTQIPECELYDTSVSIMLEGIESTQTFPVTNVEAQRIQTVLDAGSEEPAGNALFIVFDTMNGWTVAMPTSKIEALKVRIDPIAHEIEYEQAEPLSMLFLLGDGRDCISLSPPYAQEVAALASECEAGRDIPPRRFVSLRTEDDEWLYIGLEHIRLVQMSTDLITEGHKLITKDMESQNED